MVNYNTTNLYHKVQYYIEKCCARIINVHVQLKILYLQMINIQVAGNLQRHELIHQASDHWIQAKQHGRLSLYKQTALKIIQKNMGAWVQSPSASGVSVERNQHKNIKYVTWAISNICNVLKDVLVFAQWTKSWTGK
jgi:hypothetical protein